MLAEYSADIWFLFGSFAYGAETEILEFSESELLLRVKPFGSDSPAELADFLSHTVSHPKDLLGLEVRIYPPENSPVQADLKFPVVLHSDFTPSLCAREPDEPPCLRISHFRPLSPPDERTWKTLTREIWRRRAV